HMILQCLHHLRVTHMSRPQHDESLGHHAALRIGNADDRTFGDRRMGEERVLDLYSRYIVAGRNDHVVGARLIPEIAVLVLDEGVTGDVPAFLDIVVLTRIVEIAAADGAFDGETARRAARNVPALLIDDLRPIARDRQAGRAGADFLFRRADE